MVLAPAQVNHPGPTWTPCPVPCVTSGILSRVPAPYVSPALALACLVAEFQNPCRRPARPSHLWLRAVLLSTLCSSGLASAHSCSLFAPLRARQPPLPCHRNPNAVIRGRDLAKCVRRLALCGLARRPCPLSCALVPKVHRAVVGSRACGFEALRVRRAASCADILSRQTSPSTMFK
jgi:hypothetical protein